MGDARSAASTKINAHTMCTVQLKTFNKNFNYEGHYFFIYWICFAHWHSKAFHYYLKVSVIPFITIDDTKECLTKSLLKSNQNKTDFQAAIQQAKRFEELENLYEKNLQLIRQARRAIFYKRSFL